MLSYARYLSHSSKRWCSSKRLNQFSTSVAEAVEALEYVDDKEMKTINNRLDRNRDGTKKLSFGVVGPSDLLTVHQLLYATYHPTEPLTKHLGLCTGLHSLKDVDRMVKEKLAKNLTLIAYDENGKPVGVAINNSCHTEELMSTLDEDLDHLEDPAYRPIQAIHYELRQKNKHIYDEIVTDKLFDIGMIGVEHECQGQGVATNLIRRSILLAGCLGFRAIKTEATGKFSRDAFTTVGMLPASTIKYNEFEYQGEKVFAGMNDTEITFMKKKFFQSALKHIL